MPPASTTLLVGVSDGLTNKDVTVTLVGQAAGICPPPNFSVTPNAVTLTSCTGTAQVTLAGGTGIYRASSANSAVSATVTGGTLAIGRNKGGTAGSVVSTVTASDGNTSLPITVTDNAGICP